MQKDRGSTNQARVEEGPVSEEPTSPPPSKTTQSENENDEDHSMSGVEVESLGDEIASTSNQSLNPEQIEGIDNIFATILARLTEKIESRSTPLNATFETIEEEKEWFLNNTHHYFKSFHEAWPVIHGPTLFWVVESCVASSATVVMIAAWLRGERTEWISKFHKTLCDRFFETLVSS